MITSFSGDYDFLSNFYAAPIEYEGEIYPSVEHAYQAAKTACAADRQRIRDAATPGAAKRIGQTVVLTPDWYCRRERVMECLLIQKFADADLRQRLLATGEDKLVEGNYWGDTFWGVCRGRGSNRLGNILMSIRNGIRLGVL